MRPRYFGIWTRLLLAFGAISSITIIAGLSAIFLFEHSNDLFTTITAKHLPEVIQAAEFADIGAQITAMAPSLVTAPDKQTREKISNDLKQLLLRITEQTQSLQIESDQRRQNINLLLQKMKINLLALQQTVAQRLALEQRMNEHTERLRWLYADLLDEIDPLNQDLAYNLDSEIERLIGASLDSNVKFSVSRLRSNRLAKEAAETIGNNGVLLVSLILQVPTAAGIDQIEELQTLSADAISLLRTNLDELPQQATTVSLRQIFKETFSLAEDDASVFTLKKKMINETISSENILTENRELVAQLRKIIEKIVDESRLSAFSAVTRANKNFTQTRGILMFMGLLSLITSAAVLWFYVRGNIVRRLNKLGTSMQAIATGDLKHQLPPVEDDEIGRMTSALQIFRDTAQTVEDAHAQTIIDNTNAGLIITNPEGCILFINSMASELFNVMAQTIIGHPLTTLVIPRERSKLIAICRESAAARRNRSRKATFQGICHEGLNFPVDIAIRPVQQRSQKRLIVTLHDATEREMAHELLQKRVRQKTEHLSRINLRLRQEVKERKRVQYELVQAGKLAALGQLSTGITHELNQPLAAIGHYSHNAQRFIERGDTKTAEENLGKISELTERMAKIVNHLKTFARRPTNQLAPVSVATSIERALTLLATPIEKSKIQVKNSSQNTLLKALAEDIRLEQVLVNIIGNAIDAVSEMPEQDRHINIETTEQDGTIKLEVSDSGPGINTALIDVIFDPFYTTKEVGKGLGLGLSISYNIIKDFGGQLTASTQAPHGTTFTILLQKATG
jgi:two-component system, NtrC family, phosphoglycerate transport system sensor histidine kinase PgtB